MVTDVSGIAGVTYTTNGTPIIPTDSKEGNRGAISRLTENFDSFLTLLTTQLKNQDPTEPLKNEEFTNQLVQFAEVEQSVSTNEKLDALIANQSQGASAVAYLGKEIEVEGDWVELKDGKAYLPYEVEGTADTLYVGILDESGTVVNAFTQKGTFTGRLGAAWDGTDNEGNPVADGRYKVAMRSTSREEDVPVKTYSRGKVSGTEFAGGEINLVVEGRAVPVSQVGAVYEPGA